MPCLKGILMRREISANEKSKEFICANLTLMSTFKIHKYILFHNFLKIFHNAVIIYNTRNRINDTTDRKIEKRLVLMLIFGTVSQKSRE